MDGSNPEALEANLWGPSSQTIPETGEMGYMVMGYRNFDTWLCITNPSTTGYQVEVSILLIQTTYFHM